MNPALVESYLKLGLIKANTGNFKEAYYYIDKALEIEPTLEIAKNLKQQIKDYEIKQKN
jgi:lipoprotein NlpI